LAYSPYVSPIVRCIIKTCVTGLSACRESWSAGGQPGRAGRTDQYLTPMLAMRRVSSDMPPGLSLTVTTNRHSRPSVARPRSRHRPSTVVSMLPPHSGITTLHTQQDTVVLASTGVNPVVDAGDTSPPIFWLGIGRQLEYPHQFITYVRI